MAYRTKHTQRCVQNKKIVDAHVSGHEWDYHCSCPQEFYHSLIKPRPKSGFDSILQSIYGDSIKASLEMPILRFY